MLLTSKDSVSLKPCPYCGKNPIVDEDMHYSYRYRIICANFDCEVNPYTPNKHTFEEAANIWNTRFDDKEQPKKITHEATLSKCCTCPRCKNVLDEFTNFMGQRTRITYNYCHFCGQKLDWSGVSNV